MMVVEVKGCVRVRVWFQIAIRGRGVKIHISGKHSQNRHGERQGVRPELAQLLRV